jgi:hypothetical protein
MPIPKTSDTIHLKDVDGGDAKAGNGGDGYNFGDIHVSPVAYVANTQKVEGAYTKLYNGDDVWQKAYWKADDGGDGGDASAKKGFLANITNNGSGGDGGDTNSNGDQWSESGGNVAAVAADTTAQQNTQFLADQSANIVAGIGGNGGNGNTARGGEIASALVHTDPETTTTTVSNALDNFDHSFAHIDLDDIG